MLLRERALAAWEEERRLAEEAERERKRRLEEQVRTIAVRAFHVKPEEVVVDDRDVYIEDIHLRCFIDQYGSFFMLVRPCPSCQREVKENTGAIYNLTDLGRALSIEPVPCWQCTQKELQETCTADLGDEE